MEKPWLLVMSVDKCVPQHWMNYRGRFLYDKHDCKGFGLHDSHSQIMWFFRSPMAIELTLTRCAISIFLLRTLYTRMYPWLRRTGIS